MAVIAEMEKDLCRIRVENNMTIYTALDIKQQLVSYLDQVPQLEVDCSQVAEMDSAGLQILILLKRESIKRGTKLALINLSPAVTNVMDTLNMATYFGDVVEHQPQSNI